MATEPEHDIVTKTEVKQVSRLGYTWHTTPQLIPEGFLSQNFSGFQPLIFLQQIDDLFAPLTGETLQKHIILSEPPPLVTIYYYSDDYLNPISGLLFARTFIRDSIDMLTVSHDYLILPEVSRGKGIGKRILRACLEQYEKMGVSKIYVHAALLDGGYVWARAGFKAIDKNEVTKILIASKQILGAGDYYLAKAWFDNHYNNFPDDPFNIEEWARLSFMEPILRGSNWHGEIDLTNPEELRNFKKYVSR